MDGLTGHGGYSFKPLARKVGAITLNALICVTILTYANPSEAKRGGLGSVIARSLGKGGASKTYDANTLTPAMLKECILLERSIKNKEVELDAISLNVDESEEEISRIESQIARAKSTGNAEARRFLIKEYNGLVKPHNKLVAQRKSKYGDYSQTVDKQNKDCANKAYYEDDLAQVEALLK